MRKFKKFERLIDCAVLTIGMHLVMNFFLICPIEYESECFLLPRFSAQEERAYKLTTTSNLILSTESL